MCKEIWIQLFEEFIEAYEREPTDQEMQDK